ncbi:MAG TPA: hypothetical protein VJZ25_06950 [Gemmatimonadaceae bacterium]|nr:hypothetical protein [Gemmatimonadaceae bacterium]
MTLALERRSLWLMSDWAARNLAPRRLAITSALVASAYATTAIVILLPETTTFQRIPTFHGHDMVAWSYVSYATLVGLCFSLSPHVSALRGLVLAYAAMGPAGAASLAYITLVIFPDGYIKAPESLWSAFASVAVANLVTGTVALWIGLRCSPLVAALGALAALLSLPFGMPFIFVALLAFALVQFGLRALVGA